MIKNSHQQAGSAHIVIIIILAISVIGLLGFVFWQNFVNIRNEDKDAAVTTQSTTPDTTTSPTAPELSLQGLGVTPPTGWTAGSNTMHKDVDGVRYRIDFINAVKSSKGSDNSKIMENYLGQGILLLEAVKTKNGTDAYVLKTSGSQERGYVILSAKESPTSESYLRLSDDTPLFVILFADGGQDRATIDFTTVPTSEAISDFKTIVKSLNL
jgi:hypothetical protein